MGLTDRWRGAKAFGEASGKEETASHVKHGREVLQVER